jgi:hypothetical protein
MQEDNGCYPFELSLMSGQRNESFQAATFTCQSRFGGLRITICLQENH